MPMTEEERAEKRRQRARQKTEDRLVQRIEKAGHLEKTIHHQAANGSFFSFPDGKTVRADLVDRLIASGRLKPQGDGLFGDSQTYVLS